MLEGLVEVVHDKRVDVVLVAGDVFDSAMPAAAYLDVLTGALRAFHEAGAVVVITSGNHDSATRLGFQSEFAALADIHVLTDPQKADQPVMLTDEHGPVAIYGIPFLEPATRAAPLPRHRSSHTRGRARLRNGSRPGGCSFA